MNNSGVIFLDVDGVLTSKKHDRELSNKNSNLRLGLNMPLDWNCIENFYNLLLDTDANIVLSSAWRRYEEGINKIKQVLAFYRMEDRYVGETPYLLKDPRYVEILTYLNNHDYDHAVILDDTYVYDLDDHAVRIDGQIGLTKQNVEEAKKVLSKKYYGPREVYYGRW